MIGRRLLPVLLLAACRAAPLPPEARWPAGTGFDAKTLVVDGTRIRYIDAGAGPAVVLIHGFAASYHRTAGCRGLPRGGVRRPRLRLLRQTGHRLRERGLRAARRRPARLAPHRRRGARRPLHGR